MSERDHPERERDTVEIVESVLPGESATARAAHASLKGDRRGLRGLWPFLGLGSSRGSSRHTRVYGTMSVGESRFALRRRKRTCNG
jgi:hypothetical protein